MGNEDIKIFYVEYNYAAYIYIYIYIHDIVQVAQPFLILLSLRHDDPAVSVLVVWEHTIRGSITSESRRSQIRLLRSQLEKILHLGIRRIRVGAQIQCDHARDVGRGHACARL